MHKTAKGVALFLISLSLSPYLISIFDCSLSPYLIFPYLIALSRSVRVIKNNKEVQVHCRVQISIFFQIQINFRLNFCKGQHALCIQDVFDTIPFPIAQCSVNIMDISWLIP